MQITIIEIENGYLVSTFKNTIFCDDIDEAIDKTKELLNINIGEKAEREKAEGDKIVQQCGE